MPKDYENKKLKTLKDLEKPYSEESRKLKDAAIEWIKELEKKDYLKDDYPINEWTYQRRRGAIDWINIFFNIEEEL